VSEPKIERQHDPGTQSGGNAIGDRFVISTRRRRSVKGLEYEARVRQMSANMGYALLSSGGHGWILAKLDGSEELGPFEALPVVLRKLKRLAGHAFSAPMAEQPESSTDRRGLYGRSLWKTASARENRGRKAAYYTALSADERRLIWIKKRHEIHKLKKKYPEVDFDAPTKAAYKSARYTPASGAKAKTAANDLRAKLG
jgi:hypothetical protein